MHPKFLKILLRGFESGRAADSGLSLQCCEEATKIDTVVSVDVALVGHNVKVAVQRGPIRAAARQGGALRWWRTE